MSAAMKRNLPRRIQGRAVGFGVKPTWSVALRSRALWIRFAGSFCNSRETRPDISDETPGTDISGAGSLDRIRIMVEAGESPRKGDTPENISYAPAPS